MTKQILKGCNGSKQESYGIKYMKRKFFAVPETVHSKLITHLNGAGISAWVSKTVDERIELEKTLAQLEPRPSIKDGRLTFSME